MREVLVYTREGCHLCDEAREVIESVRRRIPFELVEVFIDGNDELEAEFGLRVPVILVDGEEEFEYQVDPAALEDALA